MRRGILLGLGAGLLALSSCGNSKPTLVQVICEDFNKIDNSRAITYFWSDGSSDIYLSDGVSRSCPYPAMDGDGFRHFEFPPFPTVPNTSDTAP